MNTGKDLQIKPSEMLKQIPLQNFAPFQYFPSLWLTQVFLSSVASALLILLHSYANIKMFTVLIWFRLNYIKVPSVSLRFSVETIVSLHVCSGIDSCNSRTPAGQGSQPGEELLHGWWRVPAPSLHTRGDHDGGVGVWVGVCGKEGCGELRSRCRGGAGWQPTCQTTQRGSDRRSYLGEHQKKFHFELGANNCPWLYESSRDWYTQYNSKERRLHWGNSYIHLQFLLLINKICRIKKSGYVLGLEEGSGIRPAAK